jgi:trehalose 6-phosphate synthase
MAIELAATQERSTPWTGDTLTELLAGRQLFIASNRGPVHHRMRDGQIEAVPATGGLVTALSSFTSLLPVTWISTAASPADRLIERDSVQAPAKSGSPRLRFVPVSEDALRWFYQRFANPILWFLQHNLWDRLSRPNLPETIDNGWKLGYQPVNVAHARTIAQEMAQSRRPVVLIQDYHLYLVPALLRKTTPRALIHHFTHIPWPAPGYWQPLPPAMRRQLCEGLLGADVAGFQTEESARNFLRCCERFVPGARVDSDRSIVTFGGHRTLVQDYPISVDTEDIRQLARDPRTLRFKERLTPRAGEKLIVRVDRLDPSKNIAAGFRAFGQMLERRPDLVGRVRFLAFLVPSRESIPEYHSYAEEVRREVDQVNARFGRDGWKPIEVFHEENRPQAMAGMAIADVLLVNPLADGMNLVAKEGPLVNERDGVLVLSQSCGAHVQLGRAALSIPPRDEEATARALERALEMPHPERRFRLAALRETIEAEDLRWWATRQISDLLWTSAA